MDTPERNDLKGLLYLIIIIKKKKPDRRIIKHNLQTLPIVEVRNLAYEHLSAIKFRHKHQRPNETVAVFGASGRLSHV